MATRVELDSLKRKISKTGVFRRFPNPRKSNELFLWRAVIDRALLDIIENSDEDIYKDAVLWFDIDSEDFRTVCELSDFEPDFVLSTSRKIIELFKEYQKE